MKKVSLLAGILMLVFNFLFAQNYQLPYCQFETWGNTIDNLPAYWYSYSAIDCELSEVICTTASNEGVFDNHHKRVLGYNSMGSAIQLYTVRKLNKNINGAITTGKTMLQSTDLTSPENYVYTQRDGVCHWTFAGRPDSLSFYARFSFFQNSHPKSMIRIHIHGDVDYEDKPAYTSSTAQAGKIANVYAEPSNPATTATNGLYKSPWTRFAYKFTYFDADNNVIATPTLSNTTVPSYILANISTNKSLGVGENDSLAIDNLVCIYDKGLASLQINGVEQDSLRNLFNNDEFATHSQRPGSGQTNSGQKYRSLNTLFCYNQDGSGLPYVTATPKSGLVTSCTVTQPTLNGTSSPQAVILVTHNDGSTFKYTITFSNLKTKSPITLDSPTATYTSCADQPATITASGGVNYVWSNGETGASIQPTSSGEYTVTGTNSNGCPSTAIAYVTVYPLPNVTISGNTELCSGNSTNLVASGAQTYTWSPSGATTSSINVSTGGTYSVTGTSSQGCQANAQVEVTVRNLPNVTISGVSAFCSGNTATLTASGANSYSWSNGSSNSTLEITTGGQYAVTGYSTYGCSATASHNVTLNQTPEVSISGTDILCAGDNTTLTASSSLAGTEYHWSNNSSGNSITINQGGTYSVTGTVGNCSSSDTHTVTSVALPAQPTVTGKSRCGSGSVTLTASAASGCTCVWYASANTQNEEYTGNNFTTPTLTSSKTYYVCARNASGCTSGRVPVTATINTPPSAPIVSNASYCGGGDYTLSATSPYTVQWYSDNAGTNTISATQHITQTTTFYADAIDNNQCHSSLVSETITINPIPETPTVTQPDPICQNGNVNVTLTATPGSNGTGIKWYNSDMTNVSHENTYTAKNISASTTYYASTTSATCESEKVAVNIVKNSVPNAPVLSCTPRCGAGEITLNGSANGLTVRWFDNNNTFLGSGNTYTANLSSTTVFKAKAYNEDTGCESSFASVTATIYPNYQTEFSHTDCNQYVWNNETFTESGDYTRNLGTVNNCDSIVTLHLTIHNTINTSFDTTVCNQFVWNGDTYTSTQDIVKTFTSSHNCDSVVTCHLIVRNSSSSSQTLTLCSNQLPYEYAGTQITSAGTKTITLTNAAGCDSVITLTVTVNQQPGAPTLSSNITSLCGAGNLTLTAAAGTNGTICRWYDSQTAVTPIATSNSISNNFSESTTYYLSSYNANTGCESGRTPVQITVNAVPATPQVSNVARCGEGEVTLQATADANATTCLWFQNNSSTADTLHFGFTYTRNINTTSTYYVSSYNENTACYSTRVPVVATMNPIPPVPQFSTISNCGPLTADLASYITSGNSNLYRWYDNNNNLLREDAHYNTTVSSTTSFKVSGYNAQTTCESEKRSITVTIRPTYEPQSIFDTICQNTHYQAHNIDQTFDDAGDFSFTLNTLSSLQCDSLVTLYIHVKPQITHSFQAVACEQYVWNNTPYNQSGNYTKTFTAANGCDSIVTLQLTINPTVSSQFSATACTNYQWNDSFYYQSGDYVQHFSNVNGCDSAVTLHLTINPTVSSQFSATACTSYPWNDSIYYQSGDYVQHFLNVNGCDSSVTLHLTIHPTVTYEFPVSACVSYQWNDSIYYQSGDYVQHFLNVNGCDSAVTLHLTINPTSTYEFSAIACTSYSWNGTTYHQSGDYEQHFSNVNGCDSAVTLHLTINSTDLVPLTGEVCAGTAYTDYGFDTTFTQPNVYTLTHHNQNIHGCDSTTILQLTVHPTYNTTIDESICFSESYNFHGTILNATGTYVDTLPTIHNCDSIITLNLVVFPEKRDTIYDAICLGESYNLNGFDISQPSASDVFTVTVSDVNGCDSTTVLYLTVNQPATTELYGERCQGERYIENGFNVPTMVAGESSYTLNLATSNGCDSTVVLHLTVYPVENLQLTDTVCAGEPYTNFGFDTVLTQARNHTLIYEGQSVHGCDSTVTLTLTVNPVLRTTLNAFICFDSSYNFNGNILTTSGTYFDTLSTVKGCDSIITLHLNVYPERRDTINDDVCLGEPYQLHGFNIPQATTTGYHSITNPDIHGCDSTTVLYLVVNQPATTTVSGSICLGESYTENGFNLTPAAVGIFTDTLHLQTSHGCDSTVTLTLTVRPTSTHEFDATACTSYQWNDSIYYESGDYVQHFSNVNSCDSAVTLHLTINPTVTYEFPATACTSYQWNDSIYYESGDYVQHFLNVNGCDSAVTLHLAINPTSTYEFAATECVSYQWNDSIYHESGDYVQHFSNVNGCDSTVTLHLTINPTSTHEFDAAECVSYQWNDSIYHETGDYIQHFNNVYGCDSTVTLHLTIYPTVTSQFSAAECVSYQWNDSIYNQSGDYIQHFLNVNGCDSTVTLHLTINPTSSYEFDATECVSYQWNDSIYTESGDYVQHFSNVYGCDSTVTLHLTINPTSTYEFDAVECVSYQWNDSIYTESGDYIQHFNNVYGCDSTVTLHLTINPTSTHEFDAAECVSYQWNDSIYLESGDYVQHFLNVNGCDSTVTLHLTIYPTVTYEFDAAECVSYQWNDFTYHESGDYVQHFLNVNGCDSTVTLHLTIYPTVTYEFDAVECVSYQWNDSIYYESGDYVQHFLNVNGCDSAVTLHLTIYPTVTDEFPATACTSYQWNDSIYYESGDYVQHFLNVNGCDSTVTLHLTIHPTVSSQFSATECVSYQWNDSIYYESGDYVQHFLNVNGCDSAVTLHLTINPTATNAFWDTACVSYTWADTTYTQSGNYTKHFETVHGCDSTVTLHLTIHTPNQVSFFEHICANDHYVGHGFDTTITQPGTFTMTHQGVNIYGCDSTTTLQLTVHELDTTHISASICKGTPYTDNGFDIVTTDLEPGEHDFFRYENVSYGCEYTLILHLTVNPLPVVTLFDTVCAGTPYFANGFDTTVTTAGTYTMTHVNPNVNGCDSTTTLQLTVHPIYHTTLNESICFDSSYNFNGEILTVSGIYYDTLQTVNGCDSTFILNLTVFPEKRDTLTDAVCYGASYQLHGFDIPQATATGYHSIVNPDMHGCDSTTVLYLIVNQPAVTAVTGSICLGESYTENGFNLTPAAAGIVNDTLYLQTSHGCDSTVTLTLTVRPTSTYEFNVTECVSYQWNDSIYYESGDYIQHFNNVYDCDSAVTLHLTINPISTYEFDVTECVSYQWNDSIYYVSGDYIQHFSNVNGCDSTVTLHLTINATSTYEFNDAACTSYSWNDSIYYESGDYVQHFLNANGCDSTVTLHLTINPTVTFQFDAAACTSYPWNDSIYYESGDYVQHFLNVNGCDSTVTLHLTISPIVSSQFSVAACTSYQWNDSVYYESGDYIQHFLNSNNCDSTVTLHLTINPTVTSQFDATACTSYQWNDSIYYESGDYIQHLLNVNGCDSTVTLHLTINAISTHEFSATECVSYQWNDSIYYESGDHVQHFMNVNGCDSIVTLHLTINPTSSYEFDATACTSYQWNDSIYYESDDYVQHFTNVYGCDSTVTLHLTIHPTVSSQFAVTECTSYQWNDSIYYESGDYIQHFLNVNGCDSAVTLHLTINTTDMVTLTDQVCSGEPYSNHGFDTTIVQAGTYTLTHQGQNIHGCDSTTTLQLTVNPVFNTTLNESICYNNSYNFNGEILTASGTYYDTLQTVSGCDSTFILNLTVFPEKRDTLYDEICLGDSYYQYNFNIQEPTTSGYHSLVTTDANGCDSTTVLYLTVNEPAYTTLYGERCQGDRYIENGFNVPTLNTGTFTYYQQQFTSHGCDSIITLYLTVYPIESIEVADTVCAGELYVNYGFDTVLTQVKKYTLIHNEPNIHGCDSTFTLQLTVLPVLRTTLNESICFDGSYDFHGNILTTTGKYMDTLTAVTGCDSIVTLNLNVYPEKRRTIVAHICKGDSYNQYNFDIDVPEVSGTYQHTDEDINGCDSTTVLELYVHELDTTYLTASVCSGEVYTENGFVIETAEPGEFEYTRTEDAAFGCEYTLILHLTVYPVPEINLTDEVCAGTHYTSYGFDTTLTEAGTHTLMHFGESVHGCDSTTTLQLTVHPVYHTTLNESICFNENYNFNGEILTTSGTYIDTLPTINNCDSVITLNLTVYPEQRDTVVAHICQGDSYQGYGFNILTPSETDIYTHTYPDIHDCDSTMVLQLFVHNLDTTHLYGSVCQGETYADNGFLVETTEPGDFEYLRSDSTDVGCEYTYLLHLTVQPNTTLEFADTACISYIWNDSTYYQSGDYVQHFENSLGCDSTVTLHLIVNSNDTVHTSQTACASYTWNGQTYEESGEYIQYFENVFGCDSIVILHLTINQSYATEDHVTICDNELPYTYGDTVFEVGTPELSIIQYQFTTSTGCDSTVTLYLTVNPTYSIDTTVSICDNHLPFIWDDNIHSFTEAGDYDIPFTTAAGCDSVIHLHFNVNTTYVQDTSVTICQGALPYYFDENHTFNQGGIYTINLLTANGCDSIWHLHLTVIPNAEHTHSQTICDSELPYTYLGETFTEAGQYDLIDTADGNCLTITHFTLFVNSTYHGYDTLNVCQDEMPLTYGDSILIAAGDYDIHFASTHSCDSLISVRLNVIPTATGVDELYVCDNDFPVTYGDETFTQEGVYEVTFHREGLCDSIVTLTLHQAERYLEADTMTVCDHELPVIWRGESFTQSGIYYDSLTTQYGCDSLFRLNLTVNENQLIVSDPITLCQGETQEWRGMILDEGGIYRDTVASTTTGCYEIYEVAVTVHPTYLFQDTVTVCSDELPYVWRGMYLNEPGTQEVRLQTVDSYCDSIYQLTLLINTSSHTDETDAVCDYDLPYLWHGQYLYESGTYYDTLPTTTGCDSTFALTLTVNASQHTTLADTICQSSLPYSWRGHVISAAGHYADTISNASGCDDIFELLLTVNPNAAVTIYDTICQGETYNQYGFDTLAAQAGTLYDQRLLSSANGCDSTVSLILTVLPEYFSEIFAETCENVPYQWHGGEYIAEGTYYDSLTTVSGCDSVCILHLTLNPTYDIFVSDSAMNGHEYQYDNFIITPSDSGTYQYDIQHYTLFGCDSIIHLTLYVAFNEGVENFTMTPQFDFYPNPTAAVLNIRGERMTHVTVYDLAGKRVFDTDPDSPETAQIDVTRFATGHYVVRVLLDDGNYVSGKIIVNRR